MIRQNLQQLDNPWTVDNKRQPQNVKVCHNNASDVASSVGVCYCHVGSRDVHQSSSCTAQCPFPDHRPFKSWFPTDCTTANPPHPRRPRVITPAQDHHIRLVHLRDRQRPATHTADQTIGLHNRSITPQTVCKRLREANLQFLNLTPIMFKGLSICYKWPYHDVINGHMKISHY